MSEDRIGLRMSAGTVDIWRHVAAELGYVTDRGPLKGVGAVSSLMEAIAACQVDAVELDRLFRAGLCETPVSDAQMPLLDTDSA